MIPFTSIEQLTEFARRSDGPFSYVSNIGRFQFQVTIEEMAECSDGPIYGPRTISKRPLHLAS
jgi:hypothetical protein